MHRSAPTTTAGTGRWIALTWVLLLSNGVSSALLVDGCLDARAGRACVGGVGCVVAVLTMRATRRRRGIAEAVRRSVRHAHRAASG